MIKVEFILTVIKQHCEYMYKKVSSKKTTSTQKKEERRKE